MDGVSNLLVINAQICHIPGLKGKSLVYFEFV